MKRVRADIKLKPFLNSLNDKQRVNLSSLLNNSQPTDIRKTVYLSSGGKYSKYDDFLRIFTFKLGYVPIHPVATLGYFASLYSRNNDKSEVVRDCFSLILKCDEFWVFDEKLPSFGESESDDKKDISKFPEGVLAEILFWLSNKPNSPIRFFTFEDAGIPKYTGEKWSLVPDENESKHNESVSKIGKFGIIDLGSSTVKLTVCKIDEHKETETLHKKAITVNLAEGFFEEKILQENPINRTVEAILDFQKEALSFGTTDIKLIGTGVVRLAGNLKEFSKIIKDRTNLNLEVVDGVREAELIFKAVIESIEKNDKDVLVVNAGGGSLEIVVGDSKKISNIYRIPIGISELNEKFSSDYPVGTINYKKMKTSISKILSEYIKDGVKKDILFYTGGELDYMLITGFPLENFTGSLSHPKKLSLENFRMHAKKMITMDQNTLHSFMPDNPHWMNGAISSNAILETISDFFKVKTIVPSNKNLNDGILLEMIEK